MVLYARCTDKKSHIEASFDEKSMIHTVECKTSNGKIQFTMDELHWLVFTAGPDLHRAAENALKQRIIAQKEDDNG